MKKIIRWFFPTGDAERKISLLFFIAIWLKFILFNIIWCRQTTFTPFSTFEMWIYSVLAALVFLIPLACFRAYRLTVVLMIALDCLLISNLLYFRTYYSAIPLRSYGLAGNLSDFMASVFASFRWVDILFLLLTIVPAVIGRRFFNRNIRKGRTEKRRRIVAARYGLVIVTVATAAFSVLLAKGGFRKAYQSLQGANMHSCATPMYTVFGTLYYDLLKGRMEYTPEIGEEINRWLGENEKRVEMNSYDPGVIL